ncbi:hypothetical protein MJT46_003569 [Ovis ammon polii x Ovis aries]|nr:hypothetical protein MJT46_003569 [Ovis ammon polii x Ovis aries]
MAVLGAAPRGGTASEQDTGAGLHHRRCLLKYFQREEREENGVRDTHALTTQIFSVFITLCWLQFHSTSLPLGGGGRVAVMGPDKRAGQSLLLVSVPGGGDCRGPGWRSSPSSVETVLAGEEWLTCCDDERPPTVLRRPDMGPSPCTSRCSQSPAEPLAERSTRV